MAAKDPLEVWRRSVRRCLRDWVRDNGAVPGLVCFVSRAGNPRKVEMLRLELLPDRSAVRTTIRAEAEQHGSSFAAYGALLRSDDAGHRFGLVSMDAERVLADVAVADEKSGLGAWEAGSFALADNVSFVQGVLR